MGKYNFKKLKEQEFNKEDEIHEIFEKNLSSIFPNFFFLCHKYRSYQEGNEPDTVARCPLKKAFVLIEYKNKSKGENPIIQLTGYRQVLQLEDFYYLKDIWEEHPSNLSKEKLPERLKTEEERRKIILVCIVPFGYFTEKRDIDFIRRNQIILIEFQKYENDVILVSCHFKDQFEAVGWKKDHIVITKASKEEEKGLEITETEANNDNPLLYTEKLELDEKVKKFLLEITRYVSSSKLPFYSKIFSEGSYKGINYYLKRKSVIDLELKKHRILLWLRVIEKKDFDPIVIKKFGLRDERGINRWGREDWWKTYEVNDNESHQHSLSLLDYYSNKYLSRFV